MKKLITWFLGLFKKQPIEMEENKEPKRFISLEEFHNDILSMVNECPSSWRKGQSVFNVIDAYYGIAREVQGMGIDCFYKDDSINEFIEESYKILKERNENVN